jgi:hypothetical protein
MSIVVVMSGWLSGVSSEIVTLTCGSNAACAGGAPALAASAT